MISWHTPRSASNQRGAGQSVRSLFGGRKSLPIGSFVREDLQNHDDAKREGYGGPVEVVIRRESYSGDLLPKYFDDDFVEHVVAGVMADEGRQAADEVRAMLRADSFEALVIEDYGTTGLNGPVNRRTAEKDPEHSLYHLTNALTCFFQRNGKSGKTGKQLGSAGLGRMVYYMASKISTVLAVTLPSDSCRREGEVLEDLSPRHLFFGQTFQPEREASIDGEDVVFSSFGFLSSSREDSLSTNSPYLPYGVRDSESALVAEVVSDFKLDRSEAGLSLVIPLPQPDISYEALIRYVVRDFPIPILEGRLAVTIGGVRIDVDSLVELTAEEQSRHRNAFLWEALTLRCEDEVTVPLDQLSNVTGCLDEEWLEDKAKDYAESHLVALKFKVFFGADSSEYGYATVVVQKAGAGRKGRRTLCRRGLEIGSYSDKIFTARYNGLVYLNRDREPDDELEGLLRGSENPAHTEFRAGDLGTRCSKPKDLVACITKLHERLASALEGRLRELDKSVWADLISSGHEEVEESEQPFSLSMRSDGQTFVVGRAGGFSGGLAGKWRLRFVFDANKERAKHRAHRPGSLRVDRSPIEYSAARQLRCEENEIDFEIDPEHEDFKIAVGPVELPEWADISLRVRRLI